MTTPETVPWTENFKTPKPGQLIQVSAADFQAWVDAVLPELKSLKAYKSYRAAEVRKRIPVGKFWLYKARLMPKIFTAGSVRLFDWSREPSGWRRNTLAVYSAAARGKPSYICFDKPVDIPVLAELDWDENLSPWMSLTPNEIITLRPQLKRAHGHVGIAGLGMGWLVRRALERKPVKTVTVVDSNQAVLDYFGTPLQNQYGADRLKLVCADAYAHDWSSYDVTLWDIWRKMYDASCDQRFLNLQKTLRASGKVCEGWACWTR